MKIKNFPYDWFDSFISTFIIHKESLFSGNEIKRKPEDLLNAYEEAYKEAIYKFNNDPKFENMLSSLSLSKFLVDNDNVELLNHAIWLWAYPNNKCSLPYKLATPATTKQGMPLSLMSPNKKEDKDYCSKFTSAGVAGGGSGYVQYKTRGVLFCLWLINKVWNDPVCDCIYATKNVIKSLLMKISGDSYKENYTVSGNNYENNYEIPTLVRNLLLHIIDPDEFEPIASQRDKESIASTFAFLAKDTDPIDVKLKSIRGGLEKYLGEGSFYRGFISIMWRKNSSSELSLVQMLKIKGGLILYGPPGTGKTYTANNLAKQMLIEPHVKKLQDKNSSIDDVNAAWAEIENIYNNKENDNITNLQFHINYSYEDFMVGQTIENNSVVLKPGFIFDAIKKAKQTNDPYIVILDEINRTDISRVFGELFSAIENRDKKVMLPYKRKLKTLPKYHDFFDNDQMFVQIPNNMYFIGTMNEIDFSLERVDFALRRRFLWEYEGYKEESLEEMIADVEMNSEDDKNSYRDSCSALNDIIREHPELGPKYEIGHAFFKLSNELIETVDKDVQKLKNVLWQISIKPTIEAYCGSMDEETQKNLIEKCKKAFVG